MVAPLHKSQAFTSGNVYILYAIYIVVTAVCVEKIHCMIIIFLKRDTFHS